MVGHSFILRSQAQQKRERTRRRQEYTKPMLKTKTVVLEGNTTTFVTYLLDLLLMGIYFHKSITLMEKPQVTIRHILCYPFLFC